MKRALIVGIGAAALSMLLLSVAMYLELRYTENGAFMGAWASRGAPDTRYGDPLDFMSKWVGINQFLIDPVVSSLVGLFIGLVSHRILLPLIMGLAPIAVLHYPSDFSSTASLCACVIACWLGAKVSQVASQTHVTGSSAAS